MTDFPVTSRRVAEPAYAAAKRAWTPLARTAARQAHADLMVACAGDPTALAVLAQHPPYVSDEDRYVGCLRCPDPDDSACGDPACCGPAEPAAYPCAAVAEAIQPYGVDHALDLPPYPEWSEFYREPEVQVTLTFHANIDGGFRPPGYTTTVPLSKAKRMRRITPESVQAIRKADQ